MEPPIPQNILDWNESDVCKLIDASSEDQTEDTTLSHRYEELDHFSLGVMAKNLLDGIERRTFSFNFSLDPSVWQEFRP